MTKSAVVIAETLPGRVKWSTEDNDSVQPEEAEADRLNGSESLFSFPLTLKAARKILSNTHGEEEFSWKHLRVTRKDITDEELRRQIMQIADRMQIPISQRPRNTFIISSLSDIKAKLNSAQKARHEGSNEEDSIYYFPGPFSVITTTWVPERNVWRRIPYDSVGLLLTVQWNQSATGELLPEITHFKGIVDPIHNVLDDVDLTSTLIAMRTKTEEEIGRMTPPERREVFLWQVYCYASLWEEQDFRYVNDLQDLKNSELINLLARRMPGYHPSADANIDVDIRDVLTHLQISTAKQLLTMSPIEQRNLLINFIHAEDYDRYSGVQSLSGLNSLRNSQLRDFILQPAN